MLIDIEVCHLYVQEYIDNGNNLTPNDIASIEKAKDLGVIHERNGNKVMNSMMVDDEEDNYGHDFLLAIVKQIEEYGIKINRYCYETAFSQAGDAFIETLKSQFIKSKNDSVFLDINTSNRHLWADDHSLATQTLRQLVLSNLETDDLDRTNCSEVFNSQFWVPLKISKPKIEFTCPLLTAIWYLYRLGLMEIATLPDSHEAKADLLVNILPLHFIKSESTARELLRISRRKAFYKARKKIELYFY